MYMNFQQDFENIVIANLKASGSEVAEAVSPARAFAMLLDNRARQVPASNYKLHFSDEVLKRPEWLTYGGPITDIVNRLEEGQSIAHCLSVTSTLVDHTDALLNYWGINHLHLVVDGKRQKKYPAITKRRTAHHLYFRIEGEDFYFIDILKHPPLKDPNALIDAQLVRTADRNWPHLHRLFEPEPASNEIITDEQHKVIFSKGANAMVATDRGLVIPASGMMLDRQSSLDAMVRWGRMVRVIEILQSYVRQHKSVLYPAGNDADRRLSLTEVEDGGATFHVLDHVSQTKTIYRFP